MASQDSYTHKSGIDAQALINQSPISKYQWLICSRLFSDCFCRWY